MSSIKDFVKQWTGRGYEKGEMQPFWLSFLRDVLNVSKLEKFICFEVPVKLKHASFIDAFLSDTKVIIEQKSLSEDLTQGKSQLDSSTLTLQEFFTIFHASALDCCLQFRSVPYLRHGSTRRADTNLAIRVAKKFHTSDFLIDQTKNKLRFELELSSKAGEIVGKLYDVLRGQYIKPDNVE